jgi:hypothetical protein
MEVTITDIFTLQSVPFRGSPLEVEEGIRKHFPRAFDHVPHGDLQGLLDALNHMYGYAVAVGEATNFIPPKRRTIKRPLATDDPWLREVDSLPPPSSL